MSSNPSVWSREEDKAFENAIALHWNNEDTNNTDATSSSSTWEKIASLVPTKTIEELKRHYQMLLEDVTVIDSGTIPLPSYNNNGGHDDSAATSLASSTGRASSTSEKRLSSSGNNGGGFAALGGLVDTKGGGSSRSEQERKKGIPWTEEEHRLFLLGLDKFGKGDWRSISRNFVISRIPTQVASHAQKYFIRLNSMNRDRRRSSIHDITSVNNGGDVPNHQAPITGQQTNAYAQSAAAIVGPPSVKHRPHQPHMAGLGMYGAPMGHPVAAPPGHMASAVGTPVMLPPGHHPHHAHHPPYVVPVAYPMAHPTMHQ